MSGPQKVTRGLHVEIDPKTGKLIGIPDEWKNSGLIPKSMLGDQENLS